MSRRYISAMTGPALQTPCIKICQLDPTSGLCLGCKRSLREIAAWGSMPDAMRAAIMKALPDRVIPHPAPASL